MKFKLPNGVTTRFGRQLLQVRKVSPQLMFAGGVAGVVGATVLACRATLKVGETLEPSSELIAAVEAIREGDKAFDEKKLNKDELKIKVRAALDVTKLYAPAFAIGMASIGLLTCSHVTLTRRNSAMMAAYAAVDEMFKAYRERVRGEYGEDVDRDFVSGTRQVVKKVKENGETKTITVPETIEGMPSQYAKFFDESCPEWKSNPELNAVFLRCQQSYANERLLANGWLLLNDVYESLGIPKTKAGCVVGWTVWGDGDGYVDFGIFNRDANQSARTFVNGNDPSVRLDFNVDGIIWDHIERSTS